MILVFGFGVWFLLFVFWFGGFGVFGVCGWFGVLCFVV